MRKAGQVQDDLLRFFVQPLHRNVFGHLVVSMLFTKVGNIQKIPKMWLTN